MADFTVDWASHNFPVWEKILRGVRPAANVLEIGSWEGRSATWFLEYLPESRVTCVDTFAGSDEHASMTGDLQVIEARFDANMAPYVDRLEKIKNTSHAALVRLGLDLRRFDVIYVDGSHRPADVYADGVLAWPLLRPHGVLIFDDYEWNGPDYSPRPGIDAFLARTDHRVISCGYQMIIGKQ